MKSNQATCKSTVHEHLILFWRQHYPESEVLRCFNTASAIKVRHHSRLILMRTHMCGYVNIYTERERERETLCVGNLGMGDQDQPQSRICGMILTHASLPAPCQQTLQNTHAQRAASYYGQTKQASITRRRPTSHSTRLFLLGCSSPSTAASGSPESNSCANSTSSAGACEQMKGTRI